MVVLKTQINLRPPEYAERHGFSLSRLMRVLLVLVVIVIFGGVFLYMDIRRSELAAEVSLLQGELKTLEKRVERLQELEEEVSSVQLGVEREENLLERKHYWSRYLRQFEHKTGNKVALTRVEAPGASPVFLQGVSDEMAEVALFAQEIATLEFIEAAELVYMERDADEGVYSFQVAAELIKQEELVEENEI